MRSNPTRVHLIPLLLLILISAGNAASAANVYHFKGKSAYAYSSSFDTSGCIYTSVTVYIAENVSHSPGDRSARSYAGVSFSSLDRCNGWQTVASGYGERTLEPGTFGFQGNLSRAAVVTEVAAYDWFNGVTRTFEVDLTWTATGDSWTGNTREVYQGPGYRYVYRYSGSNRAAEVAGTVLLDGATILSGPASYGYLYNARNGTFEMIRQE